MTKRMGLIVLSVAMACGCKSSKPAVVSEYEKTSGNSVDNDPSGAITLAWFQAHPDVAKKISDECRTNAQTKTLVAGSQENAVCVNAANPAAFQHHYDNVK